MFFVIPAQAGTQGFWEAPYWIPAFAGMTHADEAAGFVRALYWVPAFAGMTHADKAAGFVR